MDLRRVSSPITRQQKLAVVSVEEVKAQARVTHSSEDELIAGYIAAAFDHLNGPDGWLNGYCLLPETYEISAWAVPQDGLEIPLRPLRQAVDAVVIETRSGDGTYAVFASDGYHVVTRDGFPFLHHASGTVWPSAYGTPHPETFRITVLVGHASADDVPEPIRLGIKMLASYWFSQREAVGPAGKAAAQSIPFGLQALCGRYRIAHDHS